MMQLFDSFDEFRCWFNQRFSLSMNGKFFGLLRLAEQGIDWKHFQYKLYKLLNGYYRKPTDDIISIRMHGVSLKLYNR